jgi:hypothetical protein
MKQILISCLVAFISTGAFAQNTQKDFSKIDPSKKILMAEVSCGECQFKMKGKGCHLAVRLDNKTYWVDGADVDSFGDAHDKNMGFCNKVRKADVQGEVKNDRFQLTYLKFADEKPKHG